MTNQTILKVLRDAGQYFHTYSGSTFVVVLDQIDTQKTTSIAQDIALLCALNIRIILIVPPTNATALPIISEEKLEQQLIEIQVTLRKVEVLLNQAFHQYQISSAIVSSSSVTARPFGVHNGIDYGYFGKPRNIKANLLQHILQSASCLMIPTFGFAPTGETFVMGGIEMASQIASALQCQKLMILTSQDSARLPREMSAQMAHSTLSDAIPNSLSQLIQHGISAINKGVDRVHILNTHSEGSLIIELLTRDGIGTMITNEPYDEIRLAELSDIPALKQLMTPLENEGVLKTRSISELEHDIQHFYLTFRDQSLIGAVAYYPYPHEKTAELASLIVHPDYRKGKKANALLHFIEQKAKSDGFNSLFILTTQSAHWFMDNGFKPAKINDLPATKLDVYDYTRQSKVFFKPLISHK